MLSTLLYYSLATVVLGLTGKYLEKTKYAEITVQDVLLTVNTLLALTKEQSAIHKTTGTRKLIILNQGKNQATVLATLRQITGVDYDKAKSIVNSAPSTVLTNISDQEAQLSKEALEFVGAKCKIL